MYPGLSLRGGGGGGGGEHQKKLRILVTTPSAKLSIPMENNFSVLCPDITGNH